jgi:energy-coupling factor transport system permease protein
MSSTTTGTTGTTDPTGPKIEPPGATTSTATARWRTVDVVVASALAVAFGVVFWAWGNLWNAVQPAFTAFPPGQGFMYGVWLMPGVLGALVLRKRGAAVYVELLASIVSALLGTSWGLTVIAYGRVQGAAAEIVFAFALYKSWRLGTALVAGALAGAAAALMDLVLYYVELGWSGAWQLTYVALLAVSSAVVAGLGSWLLVRALARTGVLAPFGSGADQARV